MPPTGDVIPLTLAVKATYANSILMRSVFNEPETASLVDLTHLHQ